MSLESAGALMRPCIESFQAAAAADLSVTSALHQFRLQAKRLRYTLELLCDARATAATLLLSQLLKHLQEQLGKINDHASAAEILDAVADSSADSEAQSEARLLAERERRSLDAGKTVFVDWWTDDGAARTDAALDEILADLTPPESGSQRVTG